MDDKGKVPGTVDEYIAGFPEAVREILARIRAVIQEAAPEAEERISYGMPAFFQQGGLIWYGAYQRHIGIYPRTGAMLEQIEALASYKGTKGSVHLPLDRPIDYELIRQIVRVRLAENAIKPVKSK